LREYPKSYIVPSTEKRLEWVGTSLRDFRAMPDAARRKLSHDLERVQAGAEPRNWKPMTSIGAGVLEMRVQAGGAFRLIYVAKFAHRIYILHAFHKKSRKTASLDLAVAQARYKLVRRSL